MAGNFWDSVKSVANEAADALTSAAADVSNSARDYGEKSKLNRAIRAEEAKRDSFFRQMGEKLYKNNPTPPAEFQEQYDGIKAAAAEIERLNAELQRMENMKK